MRLFVYTVFDTAAGVYDRPFFAQSDGVATRSFGDICVSAEHPIGQHPEHYTLFRIGEYDDAKGEIKGESPEFLATGLEMVAAAQTVEEGALKKAPQLKEVN